MGEFVFYEGNGGTQAQLGSVSDAPGQAFNLKSNGPIPNDEARSVKLFDVREGAVLTVYDNPKGRSDDDYCAIYVLRHTTEYTIATFENSGVFNDDVGNPTVRLAYRKDNGLDGQISRITVD